MKKYEIDFDKIYEHELYGKYKIIKDYNYEKNHKIRYVRILFLNTGTEIDVPLRNVINNKIIDHYYVEDTIYEHKLYGKYKIIKKLNIGANCRCLIQFFDTGTIVECSLSAARTINVRDPYAKIIYGVACFGIPVPNYIKKAYSTWHNMIRRCYDINCQSYNEYGGKGIYVVDRWLCFEYFYQDAFKIYNGEHAFEDNYTLDKDYLQMGKINKCYSLETCAWIHSSLNSQLVVLQHKLDNYDGKYSSKYIGVRKRGNLYEVSMRDQYNPNNKLEFGCFDDEIAAANAYNYYIDIYNQTSKIKNNVQYMPLDEVLSHKINKCL